MSKISIIIVTYNSELYIERCINSILEHKCSSYSIEIIIVDNCSTDSTVNLIRNKFPSIKVIKNKYNNGYGNANNLGVQHANGEYIVILNPDTIVEKKWLDELVKPFKNQKNIITTPKVLVYDGSNINSCGLISHFTGLGFTRGLKEDITDFSNFEYVSGIFGCCFAIKKDDFIKLGGFDDKLFMYGEDVDFSWKAILKGFKLLFVSKSVIRHDYILKVPPEKIYHLEKARYVILRKYLSFKDILVISPSLLITEILTSVYSAKLGFNGLKYKFKGIKDGLSIEVEKVSGDKEKLFSSLDVEVPVDQLTYNGVEKSFKVFFNGIFQLNWKLKRY